MQNNLTLEDDSLIVYLKGKLHQIKFFKTTNSLNVNQIIKRQIQ